MGAIRIQKGEFGCNLWYVKWPTWLKGEPLPYYGFESFESAMSWVRKNEADPCEPNALRFVRKMDDQPTARFCPLCSTHYQGDQHVCSAICRHCGHENGCARSIDYGCKFCGAANC